MNVANTRAAALCAGLLCISWPAFPAAPFIDPADDAEHLGPPQELLFWTPEQQVAGWDNLGYGIFNPLRTRQRANNENPDDCQHESLQDRSAQDYRARLGFPPGCLHQSCHEWHSHGEAGFAVRREEPAQQQWDDYEYQQPWMFESEHSNLVLVPSNPMFRQCHERTNLRAG